MSLRLYVPLPLAAGSEIVLPAGAARHAQVRRMQPGHSLYLFDGSGADWRADVLSMGRSEVRVRIGDTAVPAAAELPLHVTLAMGMPANERMDLLVEKATELGVACIQPLLTERSVLRLDGERAERKRQHWQAIAIAACEQCGRATLPQVQPVATLRQWLPQVGAGQRLVLSLAAGARPLALAFDLAGGRALTTLSGPEGGLSAEEQAAVASQGFTATTLGPRVLRADTAPLAVLAWLGQQAAA